MKFKVPDAATRYAWSRPARGAWVEIIATVRQQPFGTVAPRKGRVG